jgi:plasmid maintenance system antidote protein VapI
MNSELEKYKGIHPGLILERELDKRKIVKNRFAQLVDEYPQTLNAIYKGKRNIPISLAFKIDDALSLPEGTMYELQAAYEKEDYIKNYRRKIPEQLNSIRSVVFWDTDINKIDWKKKAKAIINRVFERGNTEEKKALIELYGKQLILKNLVAEQYNKINKAFDCKYSLPKSGNDHLSLKNNENINDNLFIYNNHFDKYHHDNDDDLDPIERLIRSNR